MSSPKSRTSLRILRKTLSPSKRDLTQKIQPGQTSRTETFLTILSESFLAINNNVCPFEDQIRALRLTVKHLHSGEILTLLKYRYRGDNPLIYRT